MEITAKLTRGRFCSARQEEIKLFVNHLPPHRLPWILVGGGSGVIILITGGAASERHFIRMKLGGLLCIFGGLQVPGTWRNAKPPLSSVVTNFGKDFRWWVAGRPNQIRRFRINIVDVHGEFSQINIDELYSPFGSLCAIVLVCLRGLP